MDACHSRFVPAAANQTTTALIKHQSTAHQRISLSLSLNLFHSLGSVASLMRFTEFFFCSSFYRVVFNSISRRATREEREKKVDASAAAGDRVDMQMSRACKWAAHANELQSFFSACRFFSRFYFAKKKQKTKKNKIGAKKTKEKRPENKNNWNSQKRYWNVISSFRLPLGDEEIFVFFIRMKKKPIRPTSSAHFLALISFLMDRRRMLLLLGYYRVSRHRYSVSNELYLMFPSFYQFYWVLLGSTGFYRVLLGFNLVLLSFTGFYWVSSYFCWVLPSFT